ncbi:hypothetical protein S40288_10141 [Stachybotrys chartarum IBT 40288]|nr:hypothetical protein S40288_10141 [Stachybotrys chartarum IBT 40288]
MRANVHSLAVFAVGVSAIVSEDGTGRLPAMGWASWNEYACDVNETVFLRVGEVLVDLGLKDLGYEYVNIDDCWSDKMKRRDENGRIMPNATMFPRGIKGLTDDILAMGLKMGIHSDSGTGTCLKYEGSLYHEKVDAETFAVWGIDYLKYDNCNVPEEWEDDYPYWPDRPDLFVEPPPRYDYSISKNAIRYRRMRDPLLSLNRTIQFSMCIWGGAPVERWGNETGHSWRMYGDITPLWGGRDPTGWGVVAMLNQAAMHWNDTGFWGHNDWDMLEVGNGELTYEESRSHFALWATMKTPLIIGTRLEGIKDEILAILENKELIAFNQDTVYDDSVMPFNLDGPIPETTANITRTVSHYVGTSVAGIHVFLLNGDDEDGEMSIEFSEVPGLESSKTTTFIVHDMWTGEDFGLFTSSFTVDVKSHDTATLRFTTSCGRHPNPEWMPSQTQPDEILRKSAR